MNLDHDENQDEASVEPLQADPLQQERQYHLRRRIKIIAIAFVIGLCGILLSASVAHLQYKREEDLSHARYLDDVEALKIRMNSYFDEIGHNLTTLQAFIEANPSADLVSEKTFEVYGKKILELNKHISGILKFTYVPPEAKDQHELLMQERDSDPEYAIKQPANVNRQTNVKGYAPLTLGIFDKTIHYSKGMDAIEFLGDSLGTNQIKVMPILEFVQSSLKEDAYVLCLPTKQNEQRGWVAVIFRLSDVKLHMDKYFREAHITVRTLLHARRNLNENIATKEIIIGNINQIASDGIYKQQTRRQAIGNLLISSQYYPTGSYINIYRSMIPRTLFLAGLLITLLTTGYFVAFLQRHQNLELLVKFRTLELLQTNDLLRKEISEKTQYENALEESQTLYQSLVNELPLMIYRTDIDGRFQFTNRAFENFFGISEETFFNQFPTDVIKVEIGHDLQHEDQRVLASRQSSQHVKTMTDTQGKEHHFEIRKSALHDSFNKVMGIQAAFWDVTSREHARIAQRDLETRYHTMIENLPLNFFRKDMEGRFVFASTNVCEDLQRTPHELAGLTDYDLYPPELAEKYQCDDQQVMDSGMPLHTIERNVNHDGEERFVEVVKTPVRDHLGVIVGVQGAYWDVTEKQQVETERRRLANIVASSKDAIFSLNRNGLIQIWNPGANAMYGFDPNEVIDASPDMFIPEENQAEFHKAIDDVIKGRFSVQLESQHIHRNNKYLDVALAISPILEANGDIHGVSVISRDITARKQAQTKLEKTAIALERSNNELKEFAYVASHDLQEPLRMIASYCQLLEAEYAEQLDEDGRRFIHYAVDGAKRMQTLIRDLLTYSRVDTTGKNFESIKLSQVLEVALKNLSVLINETKTVIKTSDMLPTVEGDFTQLVQLVQNLINNGIKFRGESNPVIEITYRTVQQTAFISIKDNGIGIAPEYQNKIFQIFKRLHTRDEYDGTGIGLAVCKRVVERHGGSINVSSEVGEGACFTFSLPLALTH